MSDVIVVVVVATTSCWDRGRASNHVRSSSYDDGVCCRTKNRNLTTSFIACATSVDVTGDGSRTVVLDVSIASRGEVCTRAVRKHRRLHGSRLPCQASRTTASSGGAFPRAHDTQRAHNGGAIHRQQDQPDLQERDQIRGHLVHDRHRGLVARASEWSVPPRSRASDAETDRPRILPEIDASTIRARAFIL